MTARTPLETLTLARDYLDSLLANSTKGPYIYGGQGWVFGGADVKGRDPLDEFSDLVATTYTEIDAALIVALHATAPAIRELLNDDILWLTGMRVTSTLHEQLATAILSTPHAAQWITEREAESVEKFPKPSEGSKPERLTQPLNWANAFVKPEPITEGEAPLPLTEREAYAEYRAGKTTRKEWSDVLVDSFRKRKP